MVDSQKRINLLQVSQVTHYFNSFGIQHNHLFDSKENVLSDGADELSVRRVVDEELQRKKLEIRMSVKTLWNKFAC